MLKRLLIGITLLTLTIHTGQIFAADTANLPVTATIISPGFCLINQPGTNLNFGNLDPANPVDVNTSTTVTIWCFRLFAPTVTYLISDNDGLYETGLNANRMRHTTIPTEYLPYTMSIVLQSATIPRFTNTNITINGSVLAADYQGSSVAPGNYQDTVIISIIP